MILRQVMQYYILNADWSSGKWYSIRLWLQTDPSGKQYSLRLWPLTNPTAGDTVLDDDCCRILRQVMQS